MKTHLKRLTNLAQLLTPSLLNYQDMNQKSKNYGDVIMQKKGFSEPGSLSIPILHFIGMYCNENSIYYKNTDLLYRTELIIDVLLKSMHEDGTIDLLETNFHDATVVGFLVTPIAYAYRLLEKQNEKTDIENVILDKLKAFFAKGAEGMRNGGFHTPNHRWVMAAALSLVSNILDNDIYKDEVMKYINEGIDCDEEGEYTERSVAIYDITTNESLIVIARELQMPELLEYVARNLTKNFSYLEPDGTICTLNSKRQDNSTKYYPLRHYWSYLYLAHNYDEKFAYIAEYLLCQMEKRAHDLPSFLFTGGKEDLHNPIAQYLLNPKLSDEIKVQEIKWDGHWYFPNNGIVRHRYDKISLTLLRNREVFMKYQNGDNILTVKIGSCFFGKGYFTPTKIEEIKNGYRLSAKLTAGYKKTLENPPETSEWFELPHDKREQTHMQEHIISVDVLINDNKIDVKTRFDGLENVPFKIEIMLSPNGRLDTGDVMMVGDAGSSIILKNGYAIYTLDQDTIKIENGTFAHWYTSDMRGTAKASAEHFTIYMTGFTPFEHCFTLS